MDQKAETTYIDKASDLGCCGQQSLEYNPIRHEWISVAAYFKAEKRDFEPGYALDDWLEAELEYARIQVDEFLKVLEEDGEATVFGMQKLAQSIGIDRPENIHSKTELIQAVQCACQLLPCFRTGNEDICRQITECQWRSECKKLIAQWKNY